MHPYRFNFNSKEHHDEFKKTTANFAKKLNKEWDVPELTVTNHELFSLEVSTEQARMFWKEVMRFVDD